MSSKKIHQSKALVTGADGLLGSNLVRVLLEEGFAVRVFTHPASRSTTLDDLPVERQTGDILDPQAVRAAVKGCAAVFHCAASTSMWPPRSQKVRLVNVTGTQNMLAAMQGEDARLVHVGSASSFGYGTRQNPGDEQTPYRYEHAGLDYFDSKLAAQNEVLAHAATGRVNAVVVNPTFMFGAYDATPSSGQMLVRFKKLGLPFCPPGGRNFVHVRDVAQGMVAALAKGETGQCYLLGHRNLSFMELFGLMAVVTGTRPPPWEMPAGAIRLAGRVGSGVAAITGQAPALSAEVAEGACTGCYYSPAKAVKALALPQTPIETALEDAHCWLTDNGYSNRPEA